MLWVIAEDTDAWLDATLPAEECACEALNTTAGFHLLYLVCVNHSAFECQEAAPGLNWQEFLKDLRRELSGIYIEVS